MLQPNHPDVPSDAYSEAQPQALTPAYIWDVVKRRWPLFLAPFVLVLVAGLVVLKLLPAVYLSEGRILVESQLIPTELVRPTVTALANERIQTIEQRIMTRDRLLAIAKKFNLFSGRQADFSSTEMLDFMRDRTQIKPAELRIPSNRANRQTIAFTVGFEHENPAIAMRVANEFLTSILDEDLKTRTAYAAETTRFLEREVRRLEGELAAVDAQIAQAKIKQQANPIDELQARQLIMLRAELMQKSAVYSASHPDISALQKKIVALEKLANPVNETGVNIELLERNKEAIQKNLEEAGPKLAQARLGESLERGQQAERLEVIEQPSMPQKPIKPNRLKVLALVLAAAFAAGGGLVLLLEMFDSKLRRSNDLLKFVDANLIVSIPMIDTLKERRRRKRRIIAASATAIVVLGIAIATTVYFIQEPQAFDEMRNQIRMTLKI
jgi:uncharacterized protein involved in exopolysaccharide biosynthesis